MCTKDNCPYSHVYVNPQADVCPDFIKGYCPNGKACKLKHIIVHKKAKKQAEDEATATAPAEVEPNKKRKAETEAEVELPDIIRPRLHKTEKPNSDYNNPNSDDNNNSNPTIHSIADSESDNDSYSDTGE